MTIHHLRMICQIQEVETRPVGSQLEQSSIRIGMHVAVRRSWPCWPFELERYRLARGL